MKPYRRIPYRRIPYRRIAVAMLAVVALSAGLAAGWVGSAVAAARRPASPAVAGRPTPIALAAESALAARWNDDATYPSKLAALVPLVASSAAVDPVKLQTAWSAASRPRMIALLSALTQVGVPYRARRAKAGIGFDCSGLTSWAWAQAGIGLPHQSRSQIRMLPAVDPLAPAPGDVLWYPGHVMLALGVGDAMVHASGRGRGVEVAPPVVSTLKRLKAGAPTA
jgi:cell wall-associated NlpC family hydrolase